MLEPFSASFPIENQNSPKKEPAASPKTKAEILEYLVESLCGGYKNAKVTRNAFLLGKSGVQRQIDVLIDAKSNNFDIRIVIEAKNYNKKIGIEIIEALNTKLTDVGGNLGVVVCPLGFTEGAIKEAERCDIKLYQAFDHQLGNTDALVPFRLIEPFISIYQLQIVHGALNGAQFAIPSDLSKLRFEYKGEVLSLKELVTETWNDRLFPHEKGEHLVDVGVLKVSTNNPAHFNYLEVKINIIVSENCYLKMMPVSFMKEFKSGAGNHRVSIDVYQSKEDMEKNGWKYFSSREEMELVAEPIDTFPDMKGMQVTPDYSIDKAPE